jgi:hypothetical protein
MPVFQAITGRLNERFRRGNIEELSLELFVGEESLADIASGLGVVGEPESISYVILDSIPQGMQAALKALITHNLSRDPDDRWEMTFAWAPGYDYELTLWEAPSTVVSRAGITVLLRTRYPADAHPSDLPLAGFDSAFA